ncbi:hypothetical protein RSAG8_08771, partial [Rhizoctonia solani AG-8 WAC10335]
MCGDEDYRWRRGNGVLWLVEDGSRRMERYPSPPPSNITEPLEGANLTSQENTSPVGRESIYHSEEQQVRRPHWA